MTDTENITITLDPGNLSNLDLFFEQDAYSISIAIRKHQTAIKEAITRRASVAGVIIYNADKLEEKRSRNEKLDIRVVGLLVLMNDVTPELALATIETIRLFGSLKASPEVTEALKDRIK